AHRRAPSAVLWACARAARVRCRGHCDCGGANVAPGVAVTRHHRLDTVTVPDEGNPRVEARRCASQERHLATVFRALHEFKLTIRFHIKDDKGRVRSNAAPDHNADLRKGIRALLTAHSRLDSRAVP